MAEHHADRGLIAGTEHHDPLVVPFAEVATRLRSVLDREGVAIVTGVLSEAELCEMDDLFFEDLSGLVDNDAVHACHDSSVSEAHARFLREGARKFPYATVAEHLAPGGVGFLLQKCLSHGSFAWRVRSHPKIHSAYSSLYPSAGELVSSVDVTFFTPEGTAAEQLDHPDANPNSAHVDQNQHDVRPGLADCRTYQGVLYVWPAETGCTTTTVWPGSHLSVWPRMMKDTAFLSSGTKGVHYSEVSEVRDPVLKAELMAGWQQHGRRLRVPAGSLLLWNSRTVHAGWKGAGPRLAQAVCLEPAEERPPAQRLAKLRLAALGVPSTHWARVGHQHDMVPNDAGFLTQSERSSEPCGADKHENVLLPLRCAIRPVALCDAVDTNALRPLVNVNWMKAPGGGELPCMWTPSPGSEAVLQASVRGEFACFM